MTPRYFHGGAPGRRVGDLLLPSSETGALSCADVYAPAEGITSRRHVYVTTSELAARLFAAGHPDGAIYEVEPIGELTPDPDCDDPTLSFECDRARVLRVVPFSSSARHRVRQQLLAGAGRL